MGFWKRVITAVRTFVGQQADTHEPPPTEPRTALAPRARGLSHTRTRPAPAAPKSKLPPGWVLAGLYRQGEKTPRIYATDDTDVTDGEIAAADALIVWYEDAGEDGYRWVHGARDWDSLADQVERTIVIVSPTGRGE